MKVWFIFEDGYSYIGSTETKFNVINELKAKHGEVIHICKG